MLPLSVEMPSKQKSLWRNLRSLNKNFMRVGEYNFRKSNRQTLTDIFKHASFSLATFKYNMKPEKQPYLSKTYLLLSFYIYFSALLLKYNVLKPKHIKKLFLNLGRQFQTTVVPTKTWPIFDLVLVTKIYLLYTSTILHQFEYRPKNIT